MKMKVLAVDNSDVSAILPPFNTVYKPQDAVLFLVSPACLSDLHATLLPFLFPPSVFSFSPRCFFLAQVFSVVCGFPIVVTVVDCVALFLFLRVHMETHLFQRKVWIP